MTPSASAPASATTRAPASLQDPLLSLERWSAEDVERLKREALPPSPSASIQQNPAPSSRIVLQDPLRWSWGAGSIRELEGPPAVHPLLVSVCNRALELSAIDFAVHDGGRLELEQVDLVAAGASWTMDSNHLEQEDGHGHAVDLVPYVNGKQRWEWEPLYQVAWAMKQAAGELDAPVRWGGCWRYLDEIDHMAQAVQDYRDLCAEQGRTAQADGPHYELIG